MKIFPIQLILLLFLSLLSKAVQAETTYQNKSINKESSWGSCPVNTASQKSANNEVGRGTITNTPYPGAVYLEANKGTIRQLGVSELQGNVIIQQNQTVFNADQASFDRKTNEVDARGHVDLSAPNLKLKSSHIQYNLNSQTGNIKQAAYEVGKEGANGKSKEIKQINKDELTLYDASFSTCPANINSWHISSSEIHLNNKTQLGTARGVKFNVGKVPVFYYPWFKFPLNNQRQSGFLTPGVKLQSGAGIKIPYYLNLAPNYDATLTVSNYSDQGFQFNSEFRYLTDIHKGNIEYEIIPSDRSFNDLKRDYFNIKHQTSLGKTKVNLRAEGVSDKDYFDAQSESLETSSTSSLERRLEVVHKNAPWYVSAAVEDYQVLDNTEEAPYSKLPELKLRYEPEALPKKLHLKLETESTYFDREDSVTGTRIDVGFTASQKWGDDAWFVKPSMGLRHSVYNLNDNPSGNSLNRTLPTFTLDSGLFFDRDVKGGKYTQTLEPRMFYTYTPFKDQSNIPIFDTAQSDFSATNQLFSENRFTGKDRIGDTNRLTFAVSSRLQDRKNGTELFKASIGQIFNFSDRKVTLPEGTIQTGKRSELLLELSGRLGDNFRATAVSLFNPEENRPSRLELRLNYQDKQKRIANLSFHELDSELRQLSGSASIPINNKWSLVGSFDQDLKNDRNLETLAGVEYQDCCWKTRLVMKRYLTSDNETYDNPVFLEFELKGLGNLGSSARRQLQEKIYGYDDY